MASTPQTLDQQRAQFAWKAVTEARAKLANFEEFKNLSKGAPALIMGNGLMPTLAFYESRDKAHAEALNNCLQAWLALRFKTDRHYSAPRLPQRFADTMERLMNAPSPFYMQATSETLAMLKWLRQFADAVSTSSAKD